MAGNYPTAPEEFQGDPKEWNRKNAQISNLLMKGATNAAGTVTLTANTTTTTVSDRRAHSNSQIKLTPTTANAAAATANVYQSAAAAGTITLTHANNAQTDRTFSYTLAG